MNKYNTLKIVSILWFVSIAIIMGTLLYWSFYPYNPALINSIRVEQKSTAAGSSITLDVDYCKYDNETPTITTAFVNGVIFYLNDTSLEIPIGCGVNPVRITIPQEMASGTYSIRRTWTWQPNPIRKIAITRESNKFNVSGSDVDRQQDQR